MQGHASVVTHLNELLAGELAAIDQYFIHSRMYLDWGFQRLFAKTSHEMEEERGHADVLIRRILFLEGRPNLMVRHPQINVGADVPQMLRNDLAVEYAVVAHLRAVIAHCEAVGDFVTRELLEQMLKDTEEDHAYWLEIQLGLIERVGLENYLQAQMGDMAVAS